MKGKQYILTALLLIGIAVIIYLAAQRETKGKEDTVIGINAPDIEIIDAINNRPLLSSELKGKVLFINFWASWCQPCREEMPSIEKLFKHFLDKQDFLMLTILYRDDPQRAISYLKQNGLNLPVLIDKDENTAKSYGVTGVPETYIVDKKGVVREKVIGPYQWDSPQVLTLISNLLTE